MWEAPLLESHCRSGGVRRRIRDRFCDDFDQANSLTINRVPAERVVPAVECAESVPVRRLAVVALALGRVRAQVPNVLLASVFLAAMVARQESENPELPLQRQPVEFLHEHHHRRRSQTGPTGSSPSPPVPFFFASFSFSCVSCVLELTLSWDGWARRVLPFVRGHHQAVDTCVQGCGCV